MERSELAAAVHRASHLRGEFRLRSGAIAAEYFDKYQFESDPRLLHEVVSALESLVPKDVEVLAGLELGGVPIATLLSQLTGLPAVFVRKAAKTYGTCRLAEGGEIESRQLVLVEDVVTSGGQILESAVELRARGARVAHAICVIDREAGGGEALAEAGIALRSLFTSSELERAAT